MSAQSTPRPATLTRGATVVVLTALAYAVAGWFALQLAGTTGWASPMFPAAGVAVASAAVFGWPGALGAGVGSFAVNVMHAQSLGLTDSTLTVAAPLAIATGAALQALLAMELLRRTTGLPLTLRDPRAILRFAFYGAIVACLLNATLSSITLRLTGSVSQSELTYTWWTWWAGDALGVLIGTPIVMTLIGQPREEWAPRRLAVGVPMLLGMALLAAATQLFHRWEQQRLQDTFARSADTAAATLSEQLDESIYALHAMHGMLDSHEAPQLVPLQPAANWWLEHAPGLRAIGFSERVDRQRVPEFEASVRALGVPTYRVFDRSDGGGVGASEPFVVAMRAIEPAAGNASALGVNAMSIPRARAAILAAAESGQDASTQAFKLTQARREDELGVVVYRALYRRGTDPDAARMARWLGVAFVTIDLDRALSTAMQRGPAGNHGCLVDDSASMKPMRVAGPSGCERQAARSDFATSRVVAFADKRWSLHITARIRDMAGGQHSGSWLFSLLGLAAMSSLGLLLMTVTGRARRIELAVEERTEALSHEINDRRNAEAALRDSEQRLRNILDHVPIGVVFMDGRGAIIEVNPSLRRMLGRSQAEFLQLTVADVLHPDERTGHLAAAQELLSGRTAVVRKQMRLLRGDGSYLSVRASLSALRDPGGSAIRMVGVVEDITEHLRLAETERARDAAEAANRAKSEFVSRMSHELRTPLNAMLGFAQLLGMDRRPALAPHQAAWSTQIQQAGWHLLELINDTLDMSRIESGLVQLAPQSLDLLPMVDACVALLGNMAASRAIRITHDIAPGADRVLADETRLKQVLSNLLSNAIKYNREGGEVAICARLADDGMVEVEVRDTGLGMSSQQVDALFQPYNRLGREHSSIEGTGIGLVISRRLTELMGGTLEARSEDGKGSVFTLRMPHAQGQETSSPPDPASASPSPRYHRRVVHYIEDNETNVEVMRGILVQRPQVTLEVSANGLDGLARLRVQRPDLILLDMHLPDIGGLELLRHLKDDDAVAAIPVIVLSADATPHRIEEALTLGAMHYLTKPVDVAVFIQILDDALSDLTSRWG